VTTAGTDSGAGIAAAIDGTAQIGASDAYMSDVDVARHPDILSFPLAISAQTVNYNLAKAPATFWSVSQSASTKISTVSSLEQIWTRTRASQKSTSWRRPVATSRPGSFLDPVATPPICRAAAEVPLTAVPGPQEALRLTWNASAICTVGVPVAQTKGYLDRFHHRCAMEGLPRRCAVDRVTEGRVSRRRLTTGQNPNKIDAVILESCMTSEAPGIALTLSLPERLGIAGCVALRQIGWPEYFRSSDRLLADRENCSSPGQSRRPHR
jgi:hypothetical protein